jgi:hypothetical protein
MRDFDPLSYSGNTPEEQLTKRQMEKLHESIGRRIFFLACQEYFRLFPDEWLVEKQSGGVKKALDPEHQRRIGRDVDLQAAYKETRFGKELMMFFSLPRDQDVSLFFDVLWFQP